MCRHLGPRSGLNGRRQHRQCELRAVERLHGHSWLLGSRLTELANAPIYFVRVSNNLVLKHIVAARVEGILVFAKTCPHYLLFDDLVYHTGNVEISKYVMIPPLRTPAKLFGLFP